MYWIIYISEEINIKQFNKEMTFRNREQGETEISWKTFKLYEEGIKGAVFSIFCAIGSKGTQW